MSQGTEVLTQRGVAVNVQPDGSGTERVTIPLALRDAGGNVLVPNAIELSNGFQVASIQGNLFLPNYGTFDVQNRLTVAADCVWTASYLHSIQENPLDPVVTGFAVSVNPPLPFAGGGGGGEVNDGANVGGFAEVFRNKTGVDLNFRTFQSSNASVTIAQNPNNIDLTVAGGADIRPNRVTVGNSAAGDTVNSCDFLFDTADLAASSAALKAIIEGSPFGTDILLKQGTYDISAGNLPFVIPQGCVVSGVGGGDPELGAGRATIIICRDSFAAFNLSPLSELKDVGIGLIYTPPGAVAGDGVVVMPNLSSCRNVRVYTSGVPVENNAAALTGVFVATGRSQVLDCEVNCEFVNTLIVGGIPCLYLSGASGGEYRIVSLRCDQMVVAELSVNCKVSLVGLAGRAGVISGTRQSMFDIQARTLRDDIPALTIEANGFDLSSVDVRGFLEPDIGAGLDTGLHVNGAEYSRICLGFGGYLTPTLISDSIGLTLMGCRYPRKADNSSPVIQILNVAPTFGLSRTSIIGCVIEAPDDGVGIEVGGVADRTMISGNTIDVGGAAGVGISILAGSTNTAVAVNGLAVPLGTPISDTSADAPTAAALAAAAALNP